MFDRPYLSSTNLLTDWNFIFWFHQKTNEIDGCMLNQKSTFFKISPFIQNSSLKCMSYA